MASLVVAGFVERVDESVPVVVVSGMSVVVLSVSVGFVVPSLVSAGVSVGADVSVLAAVVSGCEDFSSWTGYNACAKTISAF